MIETKKNKQKKGFTLIELLAVIVILAILALIAIPIVISIIRDSRENANKRSIQAYGRAVENAIATWQSKNDGEAPTDLRDYVIQMSGDKVKCDPEIKGIDSDDGIELTNCYVVDSKGNKKSKDKYNIKNGKVSKVGAEGESNDETGSYEEYNVGREITVAGEQYYVIANSGTNKDYVTLLKAEPLTVDEVNIYGGVGTNNNHVNRYTFENVGKTYDDNGYGGMAYYSSSTCGYVNGSWIESGCTTLYEESDVRYVIDAWSAAKFTNGELKTVNGYDSRLLTMDDLINNLGYSWEILSAGNPTVNEDVPIWVYNSNYWYWAMSQFNDSVSIVWNVPTDGKLGHYNVWGASTGAVRPVINVKKSAL